MPQIGFGPGGWIFVGLVLLFMIYLSYLSQKGRATGTISEFFLANRSVGWVVLLFSFFAVQYSGSTFIGYVAEGYRMGYWYLVFPFFMTVPVFTACLIMPRLFVLGRRNNYVTVSDYIIDRYNDNLLNALALILLLWGVIVQLLEQLLAIGHLVEGFTGGAVSYIWGVLFLLVIVLIYTGIGGLRGAMNVQALQGAIMLVGIIGLFILALQSYGGFPAVSEVLIREAPEKIGAPPRGIIVIFASFAIIALFGMYPHYVQQLFATRNEEHLKKSIGRISFMPLFIPLLVVFLGVIAAGVFPGLEGMEAEQVMPMLMADLMGRSALHYWIVVLGFTAALLSILSTSSAVLMAISSMIIKDLYIRYANRDATEQQATKIGRWSMIVVAVVGVIIVLNPPATIWRLMELKFEGLAQVGPTLILGLYWMKVSRKPLIAGLLAGTAVVAVLTWMDLRPLHIYAGVWGLMLNLIIVVLGSKLFPESKQEQERVYGSFMRPFDEAKAKGQPGHGKTL